MSSIKKDSIEFAGQTLTIQTGELAPRADASVLAQLGETVVLATVSVSKNDTQLDYFPLTIEYIEKYYAGGIISGSRFIKRERFPSDRAILVARQVDHAIRPLFPNGFKKEVNVILTLLAYDGVNNPEALTLTAASTALLMSSIPFSGPASSVMIGLKSDQLILNPEVHDEDDTELDMSMVVACNEGNILNIEGWADEVSEDKMDEVLDLALSETKRLNEFQVSFTKDLLQEKIVFEESVVDPATVEKVISSHGEEIKSALYDRGNRDELRDSIIEKLVDAREEDDETDYRTVVEYIMKKYMREGVLKEEKRASGRSLTDVREITIKPDYLPRVHGSALFQRGLTQVVSIVTLGSTRLEQQSESYMGEESKSFMHHYTAPNYSVGEAGRFSYYPGRREIGHGAIGENALLKMLPNTDDFPYTIRVASEVMSQNGSSSMASTCGTSLALMQAGVPLKAHVGGVSIGLVTNDDLSDFKLLTDIEGLEDFYGDMDFKVTGTTKGITAIQLDSKLHGVPVHMLKEALRQSRDGRLLIIEKMTTALPKPNGAVSAYAPKVAKVSVDPTRIGELIGPGGKVIKAITESTGVDIDIQEDGDVFLAGPNEEAVGKALKMIKDIVLEVEPGEIYEAEVVKLMPFGAFANITPSVSGLIHVSEMADTFVKDPSTIVKEGDKVTVRIKGIDESGKISLSMKEIDKAPVQTETEEVSIE